MQMIDHPFSTASRFDSKVLKTCCDVTVYWTGSVYDRATGLVDFYRQCLPIIEPHIRFYKTETMGEARPVFDEVFGLLPFWFENTQTPRSIHALILESGTQPNHPSDFGFVLHAGELAKHASGALRLILPTSFIADDPGALVRLMLSLVRNFEFASGHAGYAVNWYETGTNANEARQEMYMISRRYLGVDLPCLLQTLHAIEDGIKCANWLTLINDEDCATLGGIDRVCDKLGPDIPVFELDNGILLQAGPRPNLGDKNRHETLPHYRKVGRLLSPVRASSHPPFLMRNPLIEDEEATQEWLGRFDN